MEIITLGIGTPGTIVGFILLGLTPHEAGGGGEPGSGDYVFSNTGMSSMSGNSDDMEIS